MKGQGGQVRFAGEKKRSANEGPKMKLKQLETWMDEVNHNQKKKTSKKK